MSTDDAIPEPVREGRDLLDDFYGFSEDSDEQYLQGDQFRQDVYRLIVIQMHLKIEELLRSFVFAKLNTPPDPGTFTHKQQVDFVHGLETGQLIDLAARLHVLSKRGYDELTKLNAIRNKCSHNWQLHSYSTKQKLQMQKEPQKEIVPEIEFKEKNLLTPEVMKDEFIPLYEALYFELFAVHYGIVEFDPHVFTDEALETVRELPIEPAD